MNWPQRLLLIIGGSQLTYFHLNWQHQDYGWCVVNVLTVALSLYGSKPKKGKPQ